MTQPRSRRAPFRPRAGLAATVLVLAGLSASATIGFVAGPFLASPAAAQSVANPNDQPTPATVPGRDAPAERATGQVAPPGAISSSNGILSSEPKAGTRTNPLDHLPARDRAATGGTRRD